MTLADRKVTSIEELPKWATDYQSWKSGKSAPGDRSYAIHTDWRGAPVAATDERQRVAWRADVDVFSALDSERG